MEQLFENPMTQYADFPIYTAVIVVLIFLALLATRQRIRTILGFDLPAKLGWLVELVAAPLLLLSVLALVRYFMGESLAAFIGVQTMDRLAAALFWLMGAWLLNRGLQVFFWDDAFPRIFGSEAPHLLRGIGTVTIYLLALYGITTFVFDQTTTGVLISTGIIAGVLGLAAQNILSDLFSGIAVTLDRPYSVGHWIELPDGVLGQVVDITWKSTRIRSFNNSIYVIPNRLASDSIIHNYDLPTKAYSLWFTVSVDAHGPPTLVRRLLLDAVLKSSRVLKEPPPLVRLYDMTSQPYQYLVWVYFEDYMAQFMGKEQVFMNIWLEFSKVGISPAAVKFSVETQAAQQPEVYLATVADELRQTELFDLLTPAEIETLAEVCQKRIFTAGDVILKAGSHTHSMYIVSSGIVSIQQVGARQQLLELERLGPGDYFGELSLFTGEVRETTVTAVTLCELIEIPLAGLEPILQANPSISEGLAQIIAKRRAKLAEAGDSQAVPSTFARSAAEIVSKIRHAFGL